MGRSKSSAGPIDGMHVVDELVHHGIKGMHWGTRKNRSTRSISEDAAGARAVRAQHKTDGTASLSNEQLQTYITRVNLERQFNERTPSGAARKYIVDFIKNEGKQQVSTVAKAQITKQVKAAFEK